MQPHAVQIELAEPAFSTYNSGKTLPPGGYWRGNGAELPFKDGVMDYVFSSHLLEDFLDWTVPLREWIRVVKPGGYLVVLIPDTELWDYAVAHGQTPNCAHRHTGQVGELTKTVQPLGKFKVLEDRLTQCHPGDYTILFAARKES